MKRILLKCFVGSVVAAAIATALNGLIDANFSLINIAKSTAIFFVLIVLAETVLDHYRRRRDHEKSDR